MADHTWHAESSLKALADGALLARLEALAAQERESTADIVEHLMEVDRRETVIDLAYPSLFVYCVKKLSYSEAAAFSRIRAARAAASFPDVMTRLRAGSLHLDSIARLYPYLDQGNCRDLLDRASGASKREVLSLVAQLQTEPGPQRDVIVPMPASEWASTEPVTGASDFPSCHTLASAEVIPPPRHRFHFTADADLLELVERLRGLLRHKIPDGSLEMIFKEAAKALLVRLERDRQPLPLKSARATAPSTDGDSAGIDRRLDSRLVPSAVKREVWTRDGGRCAYTAPDGRRCESRDALEYDHITPWADGGRSDALSNIRLLCRAHNQRLGRRRFGPRRRG